MKLSGYNTLRWPYLGLMLLGLHFCLSGQSDKLRLLKQEIDLSIADSSQVILLNEVAWQASNANLDTSFHYASLALEKARAIKYYSGIARALNLQGLVLSYRSNSEKVKLLNEEAVEYAKKAANVRWETTALNDLSVYYYSLGLYDKAIAYGEQAITYKDDYSAYSHYNLCNYYSELGDELKEDKYLQKAIESAFEATDTNVLAFGYELMGLQWFEEDEVYLDSAQYYFEQSASLYKQLGNIEGLANALFYLGYVETWRDNYEQYESYALEAIKLLEDNEYAVLLASSYLELASYYSEEGLYETANHYAELSHEICIDGGLKFIQIDYLDIKASIAEEQGEYQNAFILRERYIKSKDELYNRKQTQRIASVIKDIELKERASENQNLLRKKEVINLKLKHQNLLLISGGLAFIVLGVLVAILIYSFIRKKMLETKLKKEVAVKVFELQDFVQQLKVSNEELERFSYVASHDIKEPIRSVILFSELIKRELDLIPDSKLSEYLYYVNSNAKHLFSLVQDLLEYTKLDQQGKRECQWLSIAEEVQRIENLLATKLDAKEILIVCEEAPLIYTDRTLLYLVLKNLIENGVKYNDSSIPKVVVSYSLKDSFHVISVKDNGIGIEPKFFEQIFKLFKRLHNRVLYKGSGIGLALCHKIALQLGGHIEVESNEEGSIFKFWLPVESTKILKDRELLMQEA